jgi:hypothetical protein
MQRRVFKDGQAFEVTTVHKPFVDMCLAGSICRDAMQILLLALVPKCDATAPPPQAGQQAPEQDFRPLGVGGTLLRLVAAAALNRQWGPAVGRKLAPRQLAVCQGRTRHRTAVHLQRGAQREEGLRLPLH